MMATAWHALPLEEVLARLSVTPDGLTQAEAEARLARVGPNALRPPPPVSLLGLVWIQLRSVVVLLLVAAAAVAAISGDWPDSAAIAGVLVLNVVLGVATELPARRALEALRRLEVPRATVLRDGEAREIDALGVVPGDVLVLDAGQAIPADARLLRAFELSTVEATLTGESLEVEKRVGDDPDEAPLAERAGMVYAATTVATGSGAAVVVATGMDTEVGRIGALAGGVEERRTPLERRLDVLGKQLAVVALAVGALVAGLWLLRGIPLHHVVPLALALAVAAVPEGLPAVVTITMALGVRRMARRHALVRRLAAVETLGSATVICADKTGTITTGDMTATLLWLNGREIAVSGAGMVPEGGFSERGTPVDPAADGMVGEALGAAALAARGGPLRRNGDWIARGDPTDVALAVVARKGGKNRDRMLATAPEVGEVPFSSERMLSASFHAVPAGGVTAFVKGAPARVLERCDRATGATGERPMDEPARRAILAANDALAARGLRVVALASGRVVRASEAGLSGLAFLGLVGLTDPPAPGAAETVARFREAGVRTVMVTGDQRRTARAVAESVGLLGPGDALADARELASRTPEELDELVGRLAVVSRAEPETKLRLVEALERRGEVVAMLGDGVNDAPALKRAAVGVTMGRRGTDVARDAADVVLQDDRFETIGAALEEGRVIYDNIRKFVFYLFSCNLAEILVFLGAGLAGWAMPLLPLQVLWLNLVTDTFPALALAVEPGEPDVMRRPPRPPRESLVSGGTLRLGVGYAALIGLSTLAAMAVTRATDPARAVTVTFMTLALAQLFHLGNARSAGVVATSRRAFSNPYAIAAVVLVVGLQLLALLAPPVAGVLHLEALDLRNWLVVGGFSLLPALLGQGAKALHRRS